MSNTRITSTWKGQTHDLGEYDMLEWTSHTETLHQSESVCKRRCRACGASLTRTFLDLGNMPLANAYLDTPDQTEQTYPLHARVCDVCTLVQADEHATPETLFTDYAFLSGYSPPWVDHCRDYAKTMIDRFDPWSILEVASNDGTLLEQFPGRNVLGVDPARNVAEIANLRGIPTSCQFFTEEYARQLLPADLVIANNVMGHVPDPLDFAKGLRAAVKPDGVVTIETPWLVELVRGCEFDTIYHEHFNYWSLRSLEFLLTRAGLEVFDCESLGVHGGSLRLFVRHRLQRPFGASEELERVRSTEAWGGVLDPRSPFYVGFADRVEKVVVGLCDFLAGCQDRGEMVAAAGAAAKGNTLLNAAAVTRMDVQFVTDTSPWKQGKYLPGSHMPVVDPEAVRLYRPDWILVLAWNWADEIIASLSFAREWGCRFVVPIPELKVV